MKYLLKLLKGTIYSIATILAIFALMAAISTVVYGETNRIANLMGDTIMSGVKRALVVTIVDGSGNQLGALGGGGQTVTTSDTLRITSISTNQCNITGETASGAKVISKTIGGVGCPQAGQTITGTALTGDTDTILGVSQQPQEIPINPLVPITADTHTNTTLDDIATNSCALIKAYMWVSAGPNIRGIASGGHMNGTGGSEPTYTTTDCTAGSVTLSAAATGTTNDGSGYIFSPAIVTTQNLDEDHITFTTMATLVSGANSDILTATYLVSTGASVTAGSFTHTPNSAYTISHADSGSLVNGSLQNVSVQATTGSPEWGAIYACVQIVRSSAVIANLVCGTPTANKPIIFPGPSLQSKDVYRIRSFASLRPATGADAIITIPSNVSWELISMNTLLSNSATSGFRYPQLQLMDKEGITTYTANVAYNQPLSASDQYNVQFAQGAQAAPEPLSFVTSADVTGSDNPATDTAPVVTMPDPGDGWRNVVDCVYGSLLQTSATAVAASTVFSLRDGATGAGTVKKTFSLGVPGAVGTPANAITDAGIVVVGGLCGLDLHMTASTVTTFESGTISGTTGVATAWIKGHVELATPLPRIPIPSLQLMGGGLARLILKGLNGVDDVWTETQFKVKETLGITF